MDVSNKIHYSVCENFVVPENSFNLKENFFSDKDNKDNSDEQNYLNVEVSENNLLATSEAYIQFESKSSFVLSQILSGSNIK